jgi:hypothetical protein
MFNAFPWLAAVCFAAVPGVTCAAISIAGSSTLWTAVPGNYDYLSDHQTGQPAGDIVGTATHPGFFVTFDDNGPASRADGTLGFRLRLDAAGGNSGNPRFDRVAWVGIDANANGSVDVFIGVSAQGSSATLGIYAPGNSENISPKTTSIAATPAYSYAFSASNYNYRPVNFTLDGGTTNDLTTSSTGDPDYYLSFAVPFADVAAFLGLNPADADQRPLRYVVATSTQHNSLNQDLGAINGGVGSTATWESLGGFTPAMNVSGTVIVPEVSSALLVGAGAILAALRRRRRTTQA